MELRLCECGCGRVVTKPGNRFIVGHNGRGKPGPMLGRHQSDSAKEKLRLANLGKHYPNRKPVSDEVRQQRRLRQLGTHESKETREKIRLGCLGKNLGKKRSDETIERLKLSHIGRCIGEKNSNYKGGKFESCPICGKLTWLIPSVASKSSVHYCSTKCFAKWKKIMWRGDRNPNWKDGTAYEPYNYLFNEVLKEQVRDRDNRTCQLCGVTENELHRKLSVHHIDYDKHNSASNRLISLCPRCNSRVNSNRQYWKKYF